MRRSALILGLSSCLVACGGGSGNAADGGAPDASTVDTCNPYSARSPALTVSVEPTAFEKPYLDVITSAKTDLRVTVYEMGAGNIVSSLEAAAKQGIAVKVILDQAHQSTNQTSYNGLTAAGAQVKWSNPKFTYTHAKFIVADGARSIISTGNFTATQLLGERNYVARNDDPADVATLVSIFDADWQGNTPDLSCTRLLVSPINSRDRIILLINSAQKTLDVESMEFADTGVRGAVVGRFNAGVAVRVLIAAPSWVSDNTDAGAFLKGLNIPARYLTTPDVHVKAIAVDGASAYLGSVNLSTTSLLDNREVGLITTDPVVLQLMATTFQGDWGLATAF